MDSDSAPPSEGDIVKALTWHGNHDVRVDTVPDPTIEQPTDAIIRVTSSGICGSDLHLYEVLGAFIDAGDILGHEPMGIVEEVGSEVTNVTSSSLNALSETPICSDFDPRRLHHKCPAKQ